MSAPAWLLIAIYGAQAETYPEWVHAAADRVLDGLKHSATWERLQAATARVEEAEAQVAALREELRRVGHDVVRGAQKLDGQ